MNKVSENPFKNRIDTPLMVVTALFTTLYLTSNIMAVKIVDFFDLIYFDAGTITFPFAYMLGDVLTEIWGYKTAKKVIFLTFLCNVLLLICTLIGVWLPSPEYQQQTAEAYNHIFTHVPRIVFGSLMGFLCGELSNAYLMDRIKKRTKGKFLWLRTIGSSVIGYLLDTVPFVLIAFAGIAPIKDLFLMIVLQYVVKLVIESFLGTPMAYLAVGWIKKYTGKQINFEFTSGMEFPEDLSKYALVIHCGGCMLTEKEMQYRLRHSKDLHVPITNYGISIAMMHGILKRSIEIFPDIREMLE